MRSADGRRDHRYGHRNGRPGVGRPQLPVTLEHDFALAPPHVAGRGVRPADGSSRDLLARRHRGDRAWGFRHTRLYRSSAPPPTGRSRPLWRLIPIVRSSAAMSSTSCSTATRSFRRSSRRSEPPAPPSTTRNTFMPKAKSPRRSRRRWPSVVALALPPTSCWTASELSPWRAST